MSEQKDARLEKKFIEILDQDWRNATDTLDPAKLKEVIAEAAKIREDNEKDWEEDQHVMEKAQELDDAESGFREIRERQTLKMKYALKVLATKT